MRHRRLRAPLVGVLAAALGALGMLTGAPAASAADFPANPVAKPGYTLDFQEEFNGTSLDTDKWLPYYLPHWASDREKAKARYTVAGGVLTERVDQDTPAWNPAYDGTVKISSIFSALTAWPARQVSAANQKCVVIPNASRSWAMSWRSRSLGS